MATFRKFNIGDKLRPTAAQANAWTDAAIANEQNKNRKQSNIQSQIANATRVPVSNESGVAVPEFSVLELTGSIADPATNENEFLNQIAFVGDAVTSTDTNKFAITQQYLPDQVIDSNAIVAGVTFARLTGATEQTNATPTSGQSTLETGSSGPCVILYDPGIDTSERFGIVRIGGGGSSSSGGGFILFQPVEICPGIGFACDCVVGRVEIASCGLGLAKDDEVTVWDASGSWLQMPDSILFASYFYAQKMAFDPEPYTNPATNGCSFIVTGAPCVEPSFL